ncbi:MAG: hypothetical protein IJ343_13970 [Clostridia bacterium]|nr:hypothetical protein [Clostridia bacterium]
MSQRISGPETGVDLSRTEAFFYPWEQDPWGRLRPPLSVEALQLSAELAAGCQGLAITPWLRAGWREATVQVDGEITALDADWQGLPARLQRQLLRTKIKGYNPIQQLLGALKERESSSTGKAVVMLHPAENGRYVLAVCFMGTGTRFYDWFSNFRISTPEGIHKGFSQLTDLFEANEERILFPETARELGLERLTLRHILQEARSPDSRFLLWLSGHSQGGAVMQVWARRKLLEEGVLPANMVGYGFASPSVATGEAVPQPEAFPLFHVHNSDDLVPRCGAAVHLGVCLTYQADEALRRACYGWPREAQAVKARLAARPVIRQMTDTPSCIVQATAFLQVLSGCGAAEIAQILGVADAPALLRLLETVDMKEAVAAIQRRLTAAHQSVTGLPIPDGCVETAAELIRGIAADTGLRPFADALGQLLCYPHRITRRAHDRFDTPYTWIARNVPDRLVPHIWQAGTPPKRIYPAKES